MKSKYLIISFLLVVILLMVCSNSQMNWYEKVNKESEVIKVIQSLGLNEGEDIPHVV